MNAKTEIRFTGEFGLKVYKLTILYYNSVVMNEKVADDDNSRLIKYQIYLDKNLQARFIKYQKNNYTEGSRMNTATIRKAIDEFLEKRGY